MLVAEVLLQARLQRPEVGQHLVVIRASQINGCAKAANGRPSPRSGRWVFRGSVEPAVRGRAWRATIALKILGEGGAEVDRLPIAELAPTEARRGKVSLSATGEAILSASKGIDALGFQGTSELLPDRDMLCELGLEIIGELLEEDAS